VGATTTSLSFFRKGGLFFTREIPIAGDRFTEDARDRHGGDFVAAEKAKVARGLFAREEEQGAGTAGGLRLELEEESRGGNPSLQNLVREILRSVRFYLKESGQGKVGHLVLTGGSAASPGFADYLAKELGMPVETFDPLSRLGEDPGVATEHRPQFAQAVGMALRGMHELFPHRLK
jgi:type IV pilus assembly protein PilM